VTFGCVVGSEVFDDCRYNSIGDDDNGKYILID
jgi:hypothetical protein